MKKKNIERKGMVYGILVALLATKVLIAEDAKDSHPMRPNLIVIMTDDQGYADVGFHGCTDIPTPHMDRIAENGVVCSSGYVTYSVCGPSRAGFMTGRYQQRFGFHRNPPYRIDDPTVGLPLSETTIAEALSPFGYRSAIIGKWHLGVHEDLHPLSRGFDEFFGFLGGGKRYFQEELTIPNCAGARNVNEAYRTWVLRDRDPVKISKYLTDELSDEAVDFIERNHEYPFFLFLSYNAPHAPLQATEEYLARVPDIEEEPRRTYGAMIVAVDDGVGKVLDKLEELNLTENTIVFFLSDNGGADQNGAINEPLRGSKSDVWEGGYRVPFAVQWPGVLPSGVVYDEPVTALDIFGTIADLVGYEADPERPLDGVNLVPYLTGEKEGLPHEIVYLWKYDQDWWGLRQGDYKLVITSRPDRRHRMYNIREDVSESNNLARDQPERYKQLDEIRLRWRESMPGPAFDRIVR